jgi:hypothetical protein
MNGWTKPSRASSAGSGRERNPDKGKARYDGPAPPGSDCRRAGAGGLGKGQAAPARRPPRSKGRASTWSPGRSEGERVEALVFLQGAGQTRRCFSASLPARGRAAAARRRVARLHRKPVRTVRCAATERNALSGCGSTPVLGAAPTSTRMWLLLNLLTRARTEPAGMGTAGAIP